MRWGARPGEQAPDYSVDAPPRRKLQSRRPPVGPAAIESPLRPHGSAPPPTRWTTATSSPAWPKAPPAATVSPARPASAAPRSGSGSRPCARRAWAISARAGIGYAWIGRWTCSTREALQQRLDPAARAGIGAPRSGLVPRSTNSELLRRNTAVRGADVCSPNARPGAAVGAAAPGPRRWPPTCISRSRGTSAAGSARLGGLSLVAGIAAAEALRAHRPCARPS